MLGCPLYRFDRVSSTMDVLARLGMAGAPEGTTVVAGYQEAGRGRADRRWVVPPGQALLASVLLRPDVAPPRLMPLSLLVADAIRESISALYAIESQIKWPNDVLVDGRKLSGVLIQTRQGALRRNRDGGAVIGTSVSIGMGINTNVQGDALPAAGTSLSAVIGECIDHDVLLRAVLDAVEQRYHELLEDRLAERLTDIRSHLAMLGERVHVVDGGMDVAGCLLGIDPDGALVLDDGIQHHRVVAGDLTRGPRAAADRSPQSGKPGILP